MTRGIWNEHLQELKPFRSTVWSHWKKNGRHELPWRSPSLKLRRTKEILDPYKILVSEIMLQQTQVPRVIGKYKEFLRAFPTLRALAKASLGDVLRVWNGLGYNRRGKYLHDAAKVIVEKHKGRVPLLYSELVELPGIGDYTARAVRVFAFNEPDVLIETNIRTALTHHFYSSVLQKTAIRDSELIELARKAAEGQEPREWHWALMDYGAHLKRSGVRNNHRSAHYTKQSKFKGSLRQVRGAILRELTRGRAFDVRSRAYKKALGALARDGLVAKEKGKWHIC